MSKKAAEGIDALVLEVTHGKAAMMKTEMEARDLARIMVGIVRSNNFLHLRMPDENLTRN